jgi:hypothetical protein
MKHLAFALPFILLAAIFTTSSAGTRTATTAERTACVGKLQPRIDAIDAKLRAGYSGRAGESLREQRRKLEDALARCRTVPAGG